MDKLSGMAVFAKVVEAESFTAAASQLGMSKSAASKTISASEDRLGARLLNRTTRRLHTNNGDLALDAALAGLGVTRLPRFICGPYLADERLEQVLREWMPPPNGIFAVYPHNRHLSASVRVFVDFLIERFGPGCDSDRAPDSPDGR